MKELTIGYNFHIVGAQTFLDPKGIFTIYWSIYQKTLNAQKDKHFPLPYQSIYLSLSQKLYDSE
jgi:hypothetical protein